ncbi:DUF6236 family protein [Streptomyces sp. NBC_01537]|uniref:DUF6236 family protein n=1 Tax=Streptomyces sp. NBC_01537 TaxID=2903896 RepID=UPI003864E2DB
MLDQIGLYYPYIHFRNEEWLKTAALYWPQLARVVPADYELFDLRTTRALIDQLDFIVPVEPEPAAQAVAPMFLDVIARHAEDLRRLYSNQLSDVRNWQAAGVDIPDPRYVSADPSPPQPGSGSRPHVGGVVAGTYWEEVTPELRDALFDSGLAVETRLSRYTPDARYYRWVAMDVGLAWVYKCAFVEELARQGRFAPTTDEPTAHIASNGWDSDRITTALLGGAAGPSVTPSAGDVELASHVGMLAIRIAIPEFLSEVRVEKIIKLRQDYKAEFDAFTSAVTETVADLRSELVGVSLPASREAFLRKEVGKRFETPLEDLRKAMRGLYLGTVYSAANLKFELPGTVAALGGGAAGGNALAGQPLLGTALGAAFAVAGLHRSAAQQRRALLSGSTVAYLLSVESGLQPPSLLRRLSRFT